MSVEMRVLDGGLEAAEPWWDDLVANSQLPSPFASHIWLTTWWEIYGTTPAPLVLCLEKNGVPIAAGAFYRRRRRLKGLLPVSELRLVGDRFVGSEGLDFVARRGHENEAAIAIERHFRQGGAGSDVLHFEGLRPGAVLLREGVLPTPAGCTTRPVHPCPYFELHMERIAPLSKSFGSRVARKSRGLLDRGGLRFDRCESAPSIERALDSLFAMHQARWTARGENGSFASEKKRAFYRTVAPRLLERDQLELFAIWDGSTPKAVLFGASSGARLFYLQSGFHDDISAYGPGNILIYQILKYAKSAGYEIFDFMKGDESYKYLWTDRETHLHLRKEYRATWKGRLAATATRVEKGLSASRRRHGREALSEAR